MKRFFNTSYRTVYSYLIKEFFFSFVVSFLFFFIIFFVNQILLLAEEILSNRVPLKYVLRLIVYSLPTILALTFPFATLVGALMAVGRLSSDNEILAMQCAGISLKRISIPFLFIGLIFSLLSFSVNDYLIPLGNMKYKQLYREIFNSNPTLELDSWSIRNMNDTILITGNVEKTSVDQMVLIERSNNGQKNVITATGAKINSGEELGDHLSIALEQIESLSTYQREKDHYTYVKATEMIYNFLLSDLSNAISEPSPAEYRSKDLWKKILEKVETLNTMLRQWRRNLNKDKMELYYLYQRTGWEQSGLGDNLNRQQVLESRIISSLNSKPTDNSLKQWRMEFYQKFAIPFSCIPFVILAFPLGILSRRSGRTFGFIAGLGLTFLYWAFLIVGRSLVMRSGVSPFIAIWASNFLLLITGTLIYFRRTSK